jgi:lipopolysaccharide biosynthesis glycosyltransferase
MLPIYLGWDQREQLAYDVAHWSIVRRASRPVLVTPLRLQSLSYLLTRRIEEKDGKLWCPISQAPMSTEFAISRFCVPFLQDHKGWALFADCDVLALGDIAELFDLADDRYAVMCVKHKHEVKDGETKMDGQLQLAYSRKNWSSVVLWNCAHPAHQRFTRFRLNTAPGRELHAFDWLHDDEIGELPAKWNHLVGVSEGPLPMSGLLHYTLGGPWFDNWHGAQGDTVWIIERDRLERSKVKRAA